MKCVAPVSLVASALFRLKMQHAGILNDGIALRFTRSDFPAANGKDAQGSERMIVRFPTLQNDTGTGNGCGGLGVPVLTGGRLSSRVALVHASVATRCLLRPGQYHLRDFARS